MKIPNYVKEILDAEPNIGRDRLAQKARISNQEARFYCKLYKFSDNKPVKRGIAVGDIHFPDDDYQCKNILLQFFQDFKPDVFILAGDQMDMGCISSFNTKKPKLTEGKRLSREYKKFQHEYLEYFKNAPEKYFMIGNHEYRVERLIEESPQYEGFIEVENNLDLEEWEIVPYNECLTLGEMNFIHGHYWNKFHAHKNVSIYGKQIFNWHVHTNQIHTMHSPVNRLPKQGVSVGCMCNKNPEWLRKKPNSWVHQFMYFYLFGNGSFVYYTPIIINGRTFINDKLYQG